MSSPLLIAALALGLAAAPAAADEARVPAAPAAAQDDHGHHDDDAAGHGAHAEGDHSDASHLALGAGLRALHPWTAATDGGAALVYVELSNILDAPVTLTSARSAAAASAELVGFVLVDGAPTHAPIAALPVDAGATIALAPFGLAIRLEGLKAPLAPGDLVPVTLVTDRGALDMVADVEAADATQHSHAGHMH